MTDWGIMVQDLFATKDVQVGLVGMELTHAHKGESSHLKICNVNFMFTPHTMHRQKQLPVNIAVQDRRIVSNRVHVERVMGLAKTTRFFNTSSMPPGCPLVDESSMYVVLSAT